VLSTELKHLNSNKKKNIKIVTSLLGIAVLVAASIFSSTTSIILQSAQAFIDPTANLKTEPKAPTVITGENVYVVWWTDKGTPNTNGEVMFRASNDGGETFGNKTNLSSTPNEIQ
jgi:hypothetical protein